MLTEVEASLAKGLLNRGEKQHDIAAFFGCNGGRIAEIAKGHRFADVKPAPKRDLPSHAALGGTYVVHAARQALQRAKLGLDSALAFLDDYEREREHSAKDGKN